MTKDVMGYVDGFNKAYAKALLDAARHKIRIIGLKNRLDYTRASACAHCDPKANAQEYKDQKEAGDFDRVWIDGSNAETRAMQTVLALSHDDEYTMIFSQLQHAEGMVFLLDAEVKSLESQRRILLGLTDPNMQSTDALAYGDGSLWTNHVEAMVKEEVDAEAAADTPTAADADEGGGA